MLFTLVGMPGSGKSCMGRILSSKLKMKLIDVDKIIEIKYGAKLQQIIDEVGVEEFRKREEEALLSIKDTDGIVSTGGSAIYSKKGMEYLRSKGIVIYLYCSYKIIEERVGDFSKRGIVLKPGQTLKDLYDERVPMYEFYSHERVSCDGSAYPKYQAQAIKLIEGYRSAK